MKINEVMTSPVEVISPDATVEEAARMMKRLDVGCIPVCDGDRIHGMITDRDIVVRIIAEGIDPGARPVRDAMTAGVQYCFEDQDLDEATRVMEEKHVRRIVVLDRDKRLKGIASLGDLTRKGDDVQGAADVLRTGIPSKRTSSEIAHGSH